MNFRQALLLNLGAAQAALASPFALSYARDAGNSTIQWGPCGVNATVPVECGTLAVPLDYTDTDSDKTLELSLIRTRAKAKQSKGSILFNFGGPGYASQGTFLDYAKGLLRVTGGQHDLIAFDPRGTGKTIPYSCFDTPEERALALAKYPPDRGDSSDVALGDVWANGKVMANICEEKRKDIGGLVGTSFVARDMMQIVDALNEDGKLRYWGVSYGTVLGAVAADMFTDRIDRMVLDGVANAHYYYHRFGMDLDQTLVADDAFRAFLAECIDVGDLCPLSNVKSTAEELEKALLEMAEDFKRAPLAVGTFIIDYNFIMTIYLQLIKSPSELTKTTLHIRNLLTREDVPAAVEYFSSAQDAIDLGNEALSGIKCGDTYPRSKDLAGVTPDLEYMRSTSKLFGSIQDGTTSQCAQWPFEAKERYSGDFNVKTPNPVLFIGNTYDPATPPDSARNMSASFDGSVMVERRGFGHGSMTQGSSCLNDITQAYFVDGTVPEADTICDIDSSIFDPQGSS